MVYFMSCQPIEVGRFFMYWAMGIMTSLVAQSVGIALGAALNLQVGKHLDFGITHLFRANKKLFFNSMYRRQFLWVKNT